MRDSGANGKKPIKEAEKLCARKAKLERVSSELTKHKNADEKLYKARADWEKTFDAISDWIALTDLKGRILRTNRSGEDFTGISSAQIVGQSCCKLVHGSEEYIPGCPLQKMLHSRQSEKAELKVPDTNRWLLVTVDPVTDKEGNLIGAVHITRDITERKRAEEALRESGEKFRSIFDNANDIIASVTKTGKILELNKKIEDILGYKPDELIGRNFMTLGLLAAKNAAKMFHFFKESVKIGGFLVSRDGRNVTEVWVNHKDGHAILLEANTTTIKEDGKLVGYLSVVRDITERKKTEEALRESEERFRTLFEQAADSIVLVDGDTGELLEFNDTAYENLGYTHEEFRKLKISDFEVIESHKEVAKHIEKIVREGRDTFETKHRTKDGRIRDVLVSSRAISISGRNFCQSIWRDVTERKKAEEAYRSLVDHSLQGLSILQDGHVIFANQALAEITSYTIDEMLAMTPEQVQAFVHPDDRELVWSRHSDRLNGEELTERYEFRGIRKDGSTCWLELHASRIEYQGKPAIQSAYVDITERKKTEEKLRESEEKFRIIAEQSFDVIFAADLDGTLTYVSPSVTEMFGYHPDEMVGRKTAEFVPESDVPETVQRFKDIAAGKSVEGRQARIVRKDGSISIMEISSCPVRKEGKIIGVQASARDITERKKAEEALKESEEKFRNLAEQSPSMIFLNKGGRIVYANQKCEEIMGYKKEEFCSPDFNFLDLIAPEYRDLMKENFRKHMRGQGIPSCESVIVNRQGNRINVIHTTKLIEIEGERTILGILTDITERKRAEKELKKSRDSLIEAQRIAHLGSWGWDIEENKLSWSEEVYRIFGLKHEEFTGDFNGFFSWVHPNDKSLTQKAVEEATSKGKPIDFEHRIILPGGTERIVYEKGETVYDESGKPVRLAGTVYDITERKRAEEALWESEEKFKSIFEHANDGVIYLDSAGNILDVNEKAAQMFGGPKQEALNKHFTEVGIFSADEIPTLMSNFEKIFAGEEVVLTVPIKNKKGQELILECSASIVKTDDGASRIMVIARDITERIKASEQIEKLAKFPAEDPNPVLRISGRGTVIYTNTAGSPLLKSWRCRVGESLPEPWHDFVLDSLSSGQSQQTEVKCDGRIFSLTFAPVVDANYVNVYGHDITERKKAEERLLEHQAKLKAMASEMLLTEERERQRLAVGLHDEVCQKLVLTKLALESSMNLVSNSNVLASLRIVCEGIGDTIEQADSLTFELSNPVLRQLGFVIALEKYLTEEIRQKHGIAFELEGDEQLSALPDEIKNCLFRVTRELLTNVVKHAHATKVKVSARESQSQIYVRVQDDGVGFKESQAGSKVSQTARFGLFSIREQLEYLGGRLEIESGPGQGTKATVVVPLRKQLSKREGSINEDTNCR